MKALASLLVLCSALVSCSDDGAQTADDGQLTAEEREWCTLDERTEEAASRFDVIFEAGLGLGLQMDAVNAQAATINREYIAQGLSLDEAARRTSERLLEDGTFIAACKQAYVDLVGG